jgi:uncharacterized protein (TIGR02285 family)
MQVFRSILAAGLLFILVHPPAAGQTVTWMTEDLPPVYIYHGPSEGQGIGDLSIRFLMAHLPEFQYRVVPANTSRIFYEMARRDGVCYWGAWRTPERQEFAVFSNRVVPGPAFRIVVDADHAADFRPFMTDKGEVDLALLADSDRLSGGYVAGQPYPGVIGAFIDAPDRRTQLSRVGQIAQLYSLLDAGRVGFIIGNGVETTYYLSRPQGNRKFVALPIKGAPTSVGYVACSKGATGIAIVARIDTLLSDDTVWARYLSPLLRWGDPEDYAAGLAVKPEQP